MVKIVHMAKVFRQVCAPTLAVKYQSKLCKLPVCTYIRGNSVRNERNS